MTLSPISRVKRDNQVVDFQFDFERVSPLEPPAENPEKEITHNVTPEPDLRQNDQHVSAYNASETFKTFSPGSPSFSFETIDDLEELPKLEKPYQDALSLTFSLILIIVGALTIAILAIIISCCFWYGCCSRKKEIHE